MSEIFRIHATSKHHGMTIRALAIAVHDAEDSGDDVELIALMEEVEGRGIYGADGIFMQFYREEWHRRMATQAEVGKK